MADERREMEYAFQSGELLFAEDGEMYTIIGRLGRGGQGEVYKVRSRSGSIFAVKWYHAVKFLSKINVPVFYRNLQRNIQEGIPSLSSGDTASQFIWPIKLICRQKDSFGYLMNIFPPGYMPLKDIILGKRRNPDTGMTEKVCWGSWFARVTAALHIVRAFEILHASGLSYQDVNEGGFVINPQNGDVLICDCDNVSPDGQNLGILGVKHFMAPEVLRREKKPDRTTDEYSLAVILFRLFLHGHPMIGQESHHIRQRGVYTDDEYWKLVFGERPHYCLAAQSCVNPVDPHKDRDVLTHCFIYPMVLMDAFDQVFTSGVADVSRRLTAREWRKVLLEVRDHLVEVDGREQFYGCWRAKPLPGMCRSLHYPNGLDVLCMPGKVLYEYHFDMYSGNYTKRVGQVISTTQPGCLGLHNESGKTIRGSLGSYTGECLPGDRMLLFPGMKLQIGRMVITVK